MGSDGTLVGSPTFATSSSFSATNNAANFGQAISLNGTTQTVSLPAGVGKHLTADNWYVSVRFRTTQTTGLHCMVGDNESGSRPWWIGVNATQLQASVGDNAVNVVPAGGVAICNDGAWHEAALAVNNNVGYLFYDGTLVQTQTVASPAAIFGPVTPSIGNFSSNGTNYLFAGQIDEVAYFNTAVHTASYTIPTNPYANNAANLTQLYHLESNALDSMIASTPTPSILPSPATVLTSATQTFTATVANDISAAGVSWSLQETSLIGSAAGTLSASSTTSVIYTPPSGLGTYHLVATALATGGVTATATIVVNPPIVNQVVCAGNSLTAGNDSSNLAVTSYPPVMKGLLGAGWSLTNAGVTGQNTQQMIAAIGGQIDTYYNASTYTGQQVAVVWEGTNDIYTNGVTGAQAYANLVTYCNARRATGWKIVIMTLLPRSNSGTPTAQEASRLACNALIRANWRTFANALADVAVDVRLGLYGDQLNNTYYYISGTADSAVHLIDAGYAIVGQYAAASVTQVTTGTTSFPIRPIKGGPVHK